MGINTIMTKAKPQLIRRKSCVINPQNVSVIIGPKKPSVKVSELKRQIVAPTRAPIPLSPLPQKQILPPSQRQIPAALSITRSKLIKDKRKSKGKATYITPDPLPESIGRISSLHRIGKGKILIIIGNGPSLLEVDIGKLVNNPRIDILSVNKPDSRVWPTKFWAFFDQSQLTRHQTIWEGYDGYIFNSTSIKRQKATSMQFKNIGGKGWSRDLTKGLHIGRSSVFASMQIGMWMQYEHIYILACDMNPDGVDGKLHFYGINPDVDPEKRKTRFKNEADFYDYAADILTEDERKKFTFCSSYNFHSFVDKFNRLDHRKAVESILAYVDILKDKGV